MQFARLPRHIGFIPDGNRRWAEARGLPKRAGYAAGIEPGLRMLGICRELGIEEVSVYGFTKENVRRPTDQVAAFRQSCVDFASRAIDAGAALRVVGDTRSSLFPETLRRLARTRSAGDVRVNLLVNYGWQWDLFSALERLRERARTGVATVRKLLASADIPRVDLVVRWGGRRRLSGFLPVQCAYADMYVVDATWPDMQPEEFFDALAWYQAQDVTMGG